MGSQEIYFGLANQQNNNNNNNNNNNCNFQDCKFVESGFQKYPSIQIILVFVKSMNTIGFLYLDLNSKVIATNMSTQVMH